MPQITNNSIQKLNPKTNTFQILEIVSQITFISKSSHQNFEQPLEYLYPFEATPNYLPEWGATPT